MTKILVVPDVHLKPWMFDQASRIAKNCDGIVVLGDLVDDWDLQDDRDAYEGLIEAAKRFDAEHPEALWCYGNHDYCYLHFDEGAYNTGFSDRLKHFVRARLQELVDAVGPRFKVVHEVDGVLFSHGGVGEEYVAEVRARLGEGLTLEECVQFTNEVASASVLWRNESPLWLRPSELNPGVEGIYQVAGHTPVPAPVMRGGILVVDTFSTYSDGRPIGTETFIVYDTETHEYEEVDCE